MAFAGVSLCAMTALALDLGLLAVSRTTCQSAADAAALVGTRTLDNKPTSVNSNQAAATTAATAVVASNNLATKTGTPNTTTVRYGFYKYYDSTTTPAYTPARFSVEQWYPSGSSLPAGEKSWTATEVVVTANQPGIFSYALGVANLNTYGRAVAVYRPRDIAMTLDMTGSMKFGCRVKANGAYMGCDPLYPQAGHWGRYPAYAANNPNAGSGGGTPASRHNPLFTTTPYNSSGESWAPNNFTAANAGGPAAVLDFYYDPGNVGSPAATLVTPTVPSLARAFQHWTPGPGSLNSPDTYIATTFDYSGWSGSTTPLTPGTYSVYPTPDTFGDQSSTEAAMGDKFPRKRGAERTAGPGTWDAAAANGAAYTLAEYLGWTNRFTGGNPTATSTGFGPPGSAKGRTDAPALTTNASVGRGAVAPSYATDWSNFRDRTWETYGYDLDVNAYVTNRPATWDPRSDPAGLPASARQVTPGNFKGYTMGPGYWGKSFFMWPPDPRPALDWRRKFFFRTDAVANAAIGASQLTTSISDNPLLAAADNNPGGGTAQDSIDQVLLRNGVGTGEPLDLPGGSNQINYRAVLAWIKQPPMCLPPNLRAGRVVYYTSIPNDVDTATGTPDEQADKAFWKYYIDYVLRQGDPNNYKSGVTAFETTGWPEGATPAIFQNAMGQYDIDGPVGLTPPDPVPYLNYLDNPNRPRANFWFGPITMMSVLNYKDSWAGTVHETQSWQLKAGVNSVLDDIRNNHPNDNVGLSYFTTNRYGFISVACSQDFDLLKASLFYPKPLVESGDVWNTPSKEFRAFDTSMNWLGYGIVQNAQSGTDPNSGMATCFNILAPTVTANPTLPTLPPAPYGTLSATRRGRRGASKVVIFETDGVPNQTSTTTYQTSGYNSYYTVDVSPGATVNWGNPAWATAAAPALAIVDKMLTPIATTTAGSSGLSTPSSKAYVYAIGFGDLFSVVPQPATATNARTFLLQVQQRGGTSKATDTGIPPYQIITGPFQTRIDSLKTAFERILQSGVQVTLIE